MLVKQRLLGVALLIWFAKFTNQITCTIDENAKKQNTVNGCWNVVHLQILLPAISIVSNCSAEDESTDGGLGLVSS